MNTFKRWFLAVLTVASIGGGTFCLANTQNVYAADNCGGTVLGFKTWYDGLQNDDEKCTLKSPSDLEGGLNRYIWIIVLNIVDIGLTLVFYISIFFTLYGGFLYITSAGKTDDAVKARKSVQNAAIGLVLSIGAVGVVRFIEEMMASKGSSGATIKSGFSLENIINISAENVAIGAVNIVYMMAGIAAVIAIVIGALTYTTSHGDASSITKAKNTILYAVIGLIIVMSAFVITNFVAGQFIK